MIVVGCCEGRDYPLFRRSFAATQASDWRCTPSIGVTLFFSRDDEVDGVLARADRGVYIAKGEGGNRVQLVEA